MMELGTVEELRECIKYGFETIHELLPAPWDSTFFRGGFPNWQALKNVLLGQAVKNKKSKPCLKQFRGLLQDVGRITNCKTESLVHAIAEELESHFKTYTRVTYMSESKFLTKSYEGHEEYSPLWNKIGILLSITSISNTQYAKFLDRLAVHLSREACDLEVGDILENKVFCYEILDKLKGGILSFDRNEYRQAFHEKTDEAAKRYNELIQENMKSHGRIIPNFNNGFLKQMNSCTIEQNEEQNSQNSQYVEEGFVFRFANCETDDLELLEAECQYLRVFDRNNEKRFRKRQTTLQNA